MFHTIMNLAEKIKSKIKIVGKVDTDTMGITEPSSNDIETKYERLTADIAEQDKIIADIEQQFKDNEDDICSMASERAQSKLRIDFLLKKRDVRHKYSDFSLSNGERQKKLLFLGIRPKYTDIVHFHIPATKKSKERDGVAIVRDENHYYLAIDLYDKPEQEDNATTIMDENEDGTFEGIWPKSVVLKEASKIEEKYMRVLQQKYSEDLNKAEIYLQSVDENESSEITRLTDRIKTLNESLSVFDQKNTILNNAKAKRLSLVKEQQKLAQERNRHSISHAIQKASTELPVVFNDDHNSESSSSMEENRHNDLQETPDFEPMEGLDLDTDTEKRFPHLPYIRGKRKMTTMNWPMIETRYEPWLRFRLMANVARLVSVLAKNHALTYVLTDDYFQELTSRAKTPYRGMTIDDVVSQDDAVEGVIVFPNQGHEDTLLYKINRRNQTNIVFVYIREDRLLFYESFSEQEIINRPRVDSYICDTMRDAGTDPNRLFGFIRNLVIAFLAMERDMERTVNHLIEEGKGSATEISIREDDTVDLTDDKDVLLRDANWYTDITVNREIPVRGYISHRWCGSGCDKYIKEVWVRPHTKSGYHRTAGVKNIP